MPVIRRRGGSLAIVHTHRTGGKLRTDHLATLAPEGDLTPQVRRAAHAKAKALGLDVTFDWPNIEAQAAARAADAAAYRTDRGVRRRRKEDVAADVADLRRRVEALEREVAELRRERTTPGGFSHENP